MRTRCLLPNDDVVLDFFSFGCFFVVKHWKTAEGTNYTFVTRATANRERSFVYTRGRARHYSPFLVCLASKKHRRKRRSIHPCEHHGSRAYETSFSLQFPILLFKSVCASWKGFEIGDKVTGSLTSGSFSHCV